MTAETHVDDEIAAAVLARLDRLRGLRGPAISGFGERIRELVVIASSSRGGSSMLSEILRASSSMLHLRAEINPFLRMVGLGYPDSGSDSDHLAAGHLHALGPCPRRLLDEELALDAGNPCETVADDKEFALNAAWRFAVQWPELNVDPIGVASTALRVLAELRRDGNWAADEVRDLPLFQLRLIRELQAAGLPIDPALYDLPGTPAGDDPRGSIGELLIEEPPFVLPRIWQRASEADVESKPLVIKTPSNAYRLEFLRALFPNARVRIIHLTRNPAASINGLYDGWRHHGFHAHRMTEPLEIPGYVDEHPQDRWWWKFDLPPGWRAFTRAPLFDVCAFQWLSCHRAILGDLANGDVDHHRIRFEDLTSGAGAREAAIARLASWLGITFDGAFRRAALEGIHPVVATAPPSPGRWRTRADTIWPLIEGDVQAVAEELGYGAYHRWI